ncbi:MAG: histidine phosphatase family protein [Proteobacteria bacterium]|nr:histidine phosphatase family protein [Burkholderiales bacterium]
MNLILWRHAEAEEASNDLARQLTAKGHRQAQRMGAWLEARLPDKYKVICSRARRSQDTARALTEKFRIDPNIDPGASYAAVLAAVNWPQAPGTIVVVGHQPTLGEVASMILAGAPADWAIKKGALWWISYRERERVGEIALRVAMSPDLL